MIVLILVLGFCIRLINLGQSLWLDEAITALAVKNYSFLEIVTKYSPGDFHPPLYYLILKLWTNVFGYSEIALRFPSVIFGALTVLVVFLIGRTLWTGKVGLVAGLFMALNPLAVYYSQEARMYSMETFLVSISVLAFLKKKWVYFVVFYSLALYTDYLPIFLLPVFFVYAGRKKLVTLLPVIFLAPMVTLVFNQVGIASRALSEVPDWAKTLGAFDLKSGPLTFIKFIIGRVSVDNKYIYGSLMTLIGSLYLVILARVRQKFIWLWFLAPIAIGIIVSVKIPIYSYFRFLFVLPAFSLLLAKGSEKSKLWVTAVVCISLTALCIFNLNPKFQREDWRRVVHDLNSDWGEVLMPSLAQSAPLKYYGLRTNELWDAQTAMPFYLIDTRVYLLRYVQEIFDKDDTLVTLLKITGYHKVAEATYNGVVVWTYIQNPR